MADASAFPYGLRALVIDDDPTWLKILEKMLRKCSYEVMSIDGETSRLMKGVRHGACDYLLKPIRMKELRNSWQHVYRKKMQVKEIEDHDSWLRYGFNTLDEKGLFMTVDSDTTRKRKDVDKDCTFNEEEERWPDSARRAPPTSSTMGRCASGLGYVARSAFKLIQIQKQHKIISRGIAVLDLGCAPGAWLQVTC